MPTDIGHTQSKNQYFTFSLFCADFNILILQSEIGQKLDRTKESKINYRNANLNSDIHVSL